MFFVGSYTDTFGLRIIREDAAKYISRRDGYPADPDDVILTNGGSIAIQVCYIIVRLSFVVNAFMANS